MNTVLFMNICLFVCILILFVKILRIKQMNLLMKKVSEVKPTKPVLRKEWCRKSVNQMQNLCLCRMSAVSMISRKKMLYSCWNIKWQLLYSFPASRLDFCHYKIDCKSFWKRIKTRLTLSTQETQLTGKPRNFKHVPEQFWKGEVAGV